MEWSFIAYIFFFVVGVGIALVSGFLGEVLHFGGDGGADFGHDISLDHDVSLDHDIGGHDVGVGHDVGAGASDVASHLSPLSPPVLSTFLVGFGFFGMFGEKALRLPPLIVAPSAAGLSIILAAVAFLLLGRLMTASQGTSHVSQADLVGLDAEVITPIPADGVGEIAYSTATGRGSCPARSETGVVIPKHSMVTIVQMVGTTAQVRETVDEQLRALGREEQTAEQTEDS